MNSRRSDLGYIFDAIDARTLGLAPHYLFLYSAVLGLEAKAVFEFGAGMSTRVILDALEQTRGSLLSCSTESRTTIADTHGIRTPHARWFHYQGLSAHHLSRPASDMLFELVLHDGSHAADVVAADLRAIVPHVRQYGLILVHDTQHSYVGEQVRQGVREGLDGVDCTLTTLPYGFGLTVVRIEGNARNGAVRITREKVGSPHRTEPCPVPGTPR